MGTNERESVEVAEQDSEMDISVGREVEVFISEIEALRASLNPVMSILTRRASETINNFVSFAKEVAIRTREDSEEPSLEFPGHYASKVLALTQELHGATTATKLVPRIFILALVGQFDAFLGRLLRTLFLLKPELMRSSERTITLAQLLEVGSVEAATNWVLEQELGGVLRQGRVAQVEWIAKNLHVDIREHLNIWPTLVEVTERRNLFAHTNGLVTEQYLTVCRKNGVRLDPEIKKETELHVDPEYFEEAYHCHLKFAVILSQILWRKLLPDQVEEADGSLMEITYNLLLNDRLKAAKELLGFAVGPSIQHASNSNRYVLVVNQAQAYKWDGDEDKCRSILDSEDWSATEPKFQLAVAVLKDEFEVAARLMRGVYTSGGITRHDYQEWPLFRRFRESGHFLKMYEQIYGEPFTYVEKQLPVEEDRLREDYLRMLEASAASEEEDGDRRNGPNVKDEEASK